MLLIIVIIACIQTYCCIQQTQILQRPVSNWQFKLYGNETWYPANVPSTVHLDLMDNNLIKDPYYRAQLLDAYWIETSDWEYETHFNINDNDELLNQQQIQLIFEGLDTHADVTFNGINLFIANNMYRVWKQDIKNLLKKGNNSIHITFHSAANYDVNKSKEFLPIVLPYNYSYTRKAAYQYGWDWGPRLLSCGIWKPVYIEAYNCSKINSVQIRTLKLIQQQSSLTSTKPQTTTAQMEINVELSVQCNYGKYQLLIESLSEGKQIINKEINVKQDQQFPPNLVKFSYQFSIENARLWWTRDQGSPNLYNFSISLKQNENLLDQHLLTTGIRTITVIQQKDNFYPNSSSFAVNLNGRNIYMKGGNYIPPDMFMPRAIRNPQIYQDTIQSAIDANFNMLRLWGGGQFEFDLFYELCDQKGILIWHDFMFACAMYPGNQEIYSNIKQEIIDNLVRLRNHPSIALWNGNNEVYIGWLKWGWQNNMTKEQRSEVWGWYNEIFHVMMPSVIKEYDPDRFYWPSSPSTTYTDNKSSMSWGDIHYWDVWASGSKIEKYNEIIGRFNSEYGMQSMPSMTSIKRFTINEDWNTSSFVMRVHQRHVRGWKLLDQYISQYMQYPSSSFESYAYASQIMQSYALQTAIEANRRAKPYNMGTLYWQLNDVWPVVSWSTVDSYGEYKAAHYKIRDLYKNIMLSVNFNQTTQEYEVFLVNDYIYGLNGSIVVNASNFFGNVTRQFLDKQIQIKADTSQIIHKIPIKEINSSQFSLNTSFLYIKFTIDKYHDIGQDKYFDKFNEECPDECQDKCTDICQKSYNNIYYFSPPKGLILPDTEITVEYNLKNNSITLRAQFLAKNVYIHFLNYENHLKLSDNYFDILPGQSHTVQILNYKLSEIKGQLVYDTLRDTYIQSTSNKINIKIKHNRIPKHK